MINPSCTHEGSCQPSLSAAVCSQVQLANSLKYSVNHTWHFAEIAPNIFALYNPIRRELVAIGNMEEILAVYRAREPFVPYTRRNPRFQNIRINI
jgi:hypothetical protein